MCLWLLGYPEQAEASWQEMFAIAERSRNPYSMGMALAWGALLYHELGQPDRTGELAERLVSLANEQRLIMWLPAALVTRGGALRYRAGDVEGAQASLRAALDIARRDQGKAYELRAATSLAVVLREVGRSDEARSLLAPVHGWFTEGSGWVDLRRAAALLAEM